MTTSSRRNWEILREVAGVAIPTILAILSVKAILQYMQEGDEKQNAKNTAALAREKIESIFLNRKSEDNEEEEEHPFGEDRPAVADLHLTSYEQTIAMELVAPRDIPVSFDDIGGLEDIIEELKEAVIYPLTMSSLYSHASSLLAAPSGVLLYGPPGCGKTMLAKALAHESGACFINLHISTLTEKWYGDSNKLVKAVFSLARKLSPTIVFIDEIDAVLGTRRSNEHEASGMVKAEFMTHWDGLVSANSSGEPQRICILGATNRINDIDDAILRRMPKKFAVPLPGSRQRRGIFDLVLRDTKKDPSKFSLDYLVRVSEGLSGSDIKEACRDAAMMPMRELIKQQHKAGKLRRTVNPEDIRGVTTDDFFRRVAPAAPAQSISSSHAGGSVLEADDVDDEERQWTDASSDTEGGIARRRTDKIDRSKR